MPAMWEAEMYKDEVDEEGCKRASEMRELAGEKRLEGVDQDWQDLVVSPEIHQSSSWSTYW